MITIATIIMLILSIVSIGLVIRNWKTRIDTLENKEKKLILSLYYLKQKDDLEKMKKETNGLC